MTQNIFTAMAEQVRAALTALYPDLPADLLARVQVEPPREAAHGDMATNAALVIAKPVRLPPAKIAAALVEKLGALPMVEKAEAADSCHLRLLPETALPAAGKPCRKRFR